MHDGHRALMRDKYIKNGIDSFAPHEILEIVLYYSRPRGDTNELAHKLIDEFGSLSNVFDANINDLCNVKGVGCQTAVLIKLIADLFGYYHKNRWTLKPRLTNVTEVGVYAVDMVGERTVESFFILSLDPLRTVTAWTEVERGTVSEANVNIRKVVECAIRSRAHSVVLVHNHPSGSLHPSEEDINVTYKVCKAFDSIGISVLDHIIVGGRNFTSMCERGLMPNI
jgi:DNA repair protein RadC